MSDPEVTMATVEEKLDLLIARAIEIKKERDLLLEIIRLLAPFIRDLQKGQTPDLENINTLLALIEGALAGPQEEP